MTWLLHILGIDNGSGRWYLWWSGAGSDLGEAAIVGALFAHYRRHICHVNAPRSCWRLGMHPVAETGFRTCRRHHPTMPAQVSATHIAERHDTGSRDSAS